MRADELGSADVRPVPAAWPPGKWAAGKTTPSSRVLASKAPTEAQP